MQLAKLSANGVYDNTFRLNLKGGIQYGVGGGATDIQLQPDGKLLVGLGDAQHGFANIFQSGIVRLLPNGKLDTEINNNATNLDAKVPTKSDLLISFNSWLGNGGPSASTPTVAFNLDDYANFNKVGYNANPSLNGDTIAGAWAYSELEYSLVNNMYYKASWTQLVAFKTTDQSITGMADIAWKVTLPPATSSNSLFVYDLQVSADGNYIAVVQGIYNVTIYNAKTGALLASNITSPNGFSAAYQPMPPYNLFHLKMESNGTLCSVTKYNSIGQNPINIDLENAPYLNVNSQSKIVFYSPLDFYISDEQNIYKYKLVTSSTNSTPNPNGTYAKRDVNFGVNGLWDLGTTNAVYNPDANPQYDAMTVGPDGTIYIMGKYNSCSRQGGSNVAKISPVGKTIDLNFIQAISIPNSNSQSYSQTQIPGWYDMALGQVGSCTTVPDITQVGATNICPATTVDLGTLATTSTTPSGSTLVWSTKKVPTTSDTLTNLNVGAGKYYAFYYDQAFSCFGPADSVTVTITICPCTYGTVSYSMYATYNNSATISSGWGTSALGEPNIFNSATNIAANRLAATSTNPDYWTFNYPIKVGDTITFWANRPTPGANDGFNVLVGTAWNGTYQSVGSISGSQITSTGVNGTYVGGSYTEVKIVVPASVTGASNFAVQAAPFSTSNMILFDAVKVSNTFCNTCPAGVDAPILSDDGGICPPATTFNVAAVTASNLPPNTTLTWHSASPATAANQITPPTAATSGTYYAAFKSTVSGCYSGINGDGTGTSKVQIYTNLNCAIQSCATYSNIISNGSFENFQNCPNTGTNNFTASVVSGWSATSTPEFMSTNPIHGCNAQNPVGGHNTTGLWSNANLSQGADGYSWIGSHAGEVYTDTLTCPLLPGTYTLTFWAGYVVESPYVTGSPIAVKDSLGNTLGTSAIVNNLMTPLNQTWKQYSITFTTTSITNILRFVPTAGSSYIYLDDFQLLTNSCSEYPKITQTTITNSCPATAANLTTLTNSGTVPAGSTLVWSTHNPPTDPNDTLTIAQTNAATGTTFYAYYRNSSGCFGPADSVTFAPTCCYGTISYTQYASSATGNGNAAWGTNTGVVGAPNVVSTGTDVVANRLSVYNTTPGVVSFANPIVAGDTIKMYVRRWDNATYLGGYTVSLNGTPSNTGVIATITTAQLTSIAYPYNVIQVVVPASATGSYSSINLNPNNVGGTSLLLFDAIKVSNSYCNLCPAGLTPPAINATSLSNTCPDTIVNLTTLSNTGIVPAGTTLVWSLHNPPTSSSDTLTAAQVGAISTSATYYVYYRSFTDTCYSPADSVMVTINYCPVCGSTNSADDFDCDGIANNIDLDDDNDGVLDTLECGTTALVSNLADWNPIEDAYSTASELVITPNLQFQRGASWYQYKIDVTKPFNYKFQANLGTLDGSGADGIAFAISADPRGVNAVGENGWGLGVYDTYTTDGCTNHYPLPNGCRNGVWRSLVLEMDTYNNGSNFGDLTANDHLSIQRNSDAGNIWDNTYRDLGNIEDGSWHNVEIDYNGSVLKVYWDNVLRITTTTNIATDFLGGETMAYIGYTSSTGSNTNLQQIRPLTFTYPGATCLDTDNDGILNVFDLDSDGDGCTDAFESGVTAIAGVTMLSGNVINGNPNTTTSTPNAIVAGPYGANGFANSVETSTESGVYKGNYTYYYALDSTVATCCAAGNTAPIISEISDTNVCPITTENLTTLTNTGTVPSGATMVWSTHNPPTGPNDTLTTAQASAVSTSGKYYALYRSMSNGCFSPADSVMVTIVPCCDAYTTGTQICDAITAGNTALGTLDCDGDGQTNATECTNGTDPTDECSNTYTLAQICAYVTANPTSPLALADCDNGGISNIIECENGGDPLNPADDCTVAKTDTTDICAILTSNPSSPLATLDCDGDGQTNATEWSRNRSIGSM